MAASVFQKRALYYCSFRRHTIIRSNIVYRLNYLHCFSKRDALCKKQRLWLWEKNCYPYAITSVTSAWRLPIDEIQCAAFSLDISKRYSTKPDSSRTNSPKPTGIIKRTLKFFNDLAEAILLRISPKLHGLYTQFIHGSRTFILDLKYVRALNVRMKNEKLQLQDLNWKDIFIKDEIKRDLGKVLPTLVVAMLPMAFYVVLPIVFAYPRPFLSDHFFNRDQLRDQWSKVHQRREAQYPTILASLKKKAKKLKERDVLEEVLNKVKKQQVITSEEILVLRPLFQDRLRLRKLSRSHLVALCKLHSVLTFFLPSWFLCMRLDGKFQVLFAMDGALLRDGITELQEEDLEKLCHQRGFRVSDIDADVLREWLQLWVQISSRLKEDKSLYLHLAVFFAALSNTTSSPK